MKTTKTKPRRSLKRVVRRLRGGIVLVASPAGGIGGVKIDRDLKATEALMMEAADEIERLHNAITESLREMERCPNDSPQDIWNEALKSWKTGLWMNHRLELQPNDPR